VSRAGRVFTRLGNPGLQEARAAASAANRTPPPANTITFIKEMREKKLPLRKIVDQLNISRRAAALSGMRQPFERCSCNSKLFRRGQPVSCGTCASENLQSINEDILGGLSLRTIGRKYSVSASGLSRHRPHIPKERAEAAAVVAPSTGSPSDQLKVVVEDLRRVAKMAETRCHLQGAVAVLKTIGSHLELLAKLSGELQQPGVAVQVNVGTRDRERWGGSSDEVLDWALARMIAHQITFEPQPIERLKLRYYRNKKEREEYANSNSNSSKQPASTRFRYAAAPGTISPRREAGA